MVFKMTNPFKQMVGTKKQDIVGDITGETEEVVESKGKGYKKIFDEDGKHIGDWINGKKVMRPRDPNHELETKYWKEAVANAKHGK